MATLRDMGITPYGAGNPAPTLRDIGIAPNIAADPTANDDQIAANGMGQLRRGYVSGSYGVDADRARAEEMSLRAGGKISEADAMDEQVRALQQRAATFAPAQQDVTKLRFGEDGGIGRGIDYGLGTIGSMAGGMADNIGSEVALGGAGRLISAIPHPLAKFVGGALQFAGPAVSYGLNNRQAVGEAGNDMVQDPELMARTTPQERNRMANISGGASALLDTAAPHMIGGRLIGRPGLKALERVPVGLKIAGDHLLEGGTEVAQSAIKKAGLAQLNPNRDTSGDENDYINDFAGGLIGSAGMSAPSHIVAAGYKRLGVKSDGDVGDKLTAKGTDNLEEKLVKTSLKSKPDSSLNAAQMWGDRMKFGESDGSTESQESAIDASHAMISKELAARAAAGDTTAQQHLDTLSAVDMNGPDRYDDTARNAAYTHLAGADGDNDGLLNAYRSRVTNSQGTLVSASDLGAGKGGGVDARSASVRATAVEREITKQRADLATHVMVDAVTNPKPQYKYLAANLAEELAEFGSKSFKNPTTGDYARVQRMAAQFVGIYGPAKAKAVLDSASKASGADGTPLHKAMSSLIDVAKKSMPQFERTQYLDRQKAADQLVSVIPPNVQLKLRKKGIDLTHEDTKEAMLAQVERHFDRAQNAPKRLELTSLFGAETLDKMRDVVGQPIEPRSKGTLEDGSHGAEEGRTERATESDKLGTGKEENAEREEQMAQKSADRSPGARQYFFKGRDKPEDGATSSNPFVRNKDGNLPTISKLDAEDHSGSNTLHNMLSKAYEALGMEFRDVKGNLVRGSRKLPGSEARQKITQNKNLSTSKDGRFDIGTTSVKSILDYHGANDSKRISTFADYASEHNVKAEDVARMKALDAKIEDLIKTTPKIKISAGELRGNPEYKAIKALKDERKALAAEIAGAADIGHTKVTGKDETGRDAHERGAYKPTSETTMADLANAYFADRHIVVADEIGGKDHDRMVLGEFRDMTDRGAKDIKFASKASMDAGKKDTPEREAGRMATEVDMNLIRFETPHTNSKKDVAVRAQAIVTWFNKNKTEFDKAPFNSAESQAKQFQNSLLSGIAAMRAEGFMVGSPYMLDAEGKKESFSDGIPPSLRLGALTQKEINDRRAKRAEKANAEYQENKLQDALTKKNERKAALTQVEKEQASEEQARETEGQSFNLGSEEGVKDLKYGEKIEGERFWSAPEQPRSTNSSDRVPSETKQNNEQQKGVPDEITDTAMRTSTMDTEDKVPTLTRANAFVKADRYADQLLGALRKDKEAGLARVNRVAAMMSTPSFVEKGSNDTVGGAFYAAPLAALLTPTNVRAFPELADVRTKVAGLLSKRAGGMTSAQKLVLAKKMNGDAALTAAQNVARQTMDVVNPTEHTLTGGKLTINGLDQFLAKYKAEPLTAKIEPAAAAAKEPARMLNEQTEAPAETTAEQVQSPEKAAPSEALIAAAKAYIAKVLGPKVKTEFLKTFDAAGEWIKAEDLIKFSLTGGPGLLTVAHHEAMHAFWDRLIESNPKAAEALGNTMSSSKMLMRLNDLLQDHPEALKSIADGAPNAQAERVAYAFQFWAAGQLDVDKPATTLFAKFQKFLRMVFGKVRESETALDIMTAFHEGKLSEPSAAGLAIDKIMKAQTWNEDVKRRFDGVVQGLHTVVAPSNDVLRKETLSATAQALARAMFTNPGEGADGQFKAGYINARVQMTRKFSNYMYKTLKGLSERDMANAMEALHMELDLKDIKSTPVRESVEKIRGLFARFHTYATEDAGMKLEYLGPKYFPRVWSANDLVARKEDFTAMLLQPKYAKTMDAAVKAINASNPGVTYTAADVAGFMHRDLVDRNGVDVAGFSGERTHEILTPFFASQKERNYKWISQEDVSPFLEKDLVGAMSRYIHQGVRAAEFERRFGEGGAKLKELVAMKGDLERDEETGKMVARETHGTIAAEMVESIAAKGIKGKEAEEMLARHMSDVKNSVQAHEGSLGGDISPAWRKLSSAAMAYQNVRLLPMALFSAFGDIMGLHAQNGGDYAKTFEAFTDGLKEVWARWKDAASDVPAERQQQLAERIAEAVGAVDSHMFLEQMGKAHTSEFMTDFARNANRKLFVANGLTAWDRSMRVSATKMAVSFLEDHSKLPDKKHSARWLADLGLEAKDIPLDADGKLIWDRHVLAATRFTEGMDDAKKSAVLKQATADVDKLHYAIVRWTEASILTPTAAQRPTWASDPHYAVLFHLKQFTYSFQHTIMKRAFNEAAHGNMNPIGALAATMPIMVASDIVKGLALGGGAVPDYMAHWGVADWAEHGFNRAGLAGVSGFGMDALHDPASLFGPTVDQIAGGAYDLVTGKKSLASLLVDATPGARLFSGVKDMARAVE